MNEKEQKQPAGFNCKTCGTFHSFGAYVMAHWRDALTHTCDNCKAQHQVQRGNAILIKPGKLENAT